MSKQPSNFTAEEIAESAWLAALEKASPSEVPAGFKTAKQLQTIWKSLGRTSVWSRVKKLQALGLVEEKTFSVKAGKSFRPIPHYRLK